MQSGKFKADMKDGKIVMSYEVMEGQFVELSAPLGIMAKPVFEGLEAKIMSGEIDLIKGVDFDKDLMIRGLAEAKKALGI